MSPRPWQVWWADLDPVEGREQAAHRPVLVVSTPFHLRLTHNQMVTVLPLTSRRLPQLIHRIEVALPGYRPSHVITEQLRTISTRRLTGDAPLCRLPDQQVDEIREVLRRMVDVLPPVGVRQ